MCHSSWSVKALRNKTELLLYKESARFFSDGDTQMELAGRIRDIAFKPPPHPNE